MKLQRIFPVVILLVLAAFLYLSPGCGKSAVDNQLYLILYAFDSEGQLLSEKMNITATDTVLGRMVHRGSLAGKNIVLAESGVGMTNAAMTIQKMIDTYNPRAVIFSGIAGAIDSSVHIGDIFVGRSWATHDYGYIGVNGFEPNGIEVKLPSRAESERITYFQVDSSLFRKAESLAGKQIKLDSIGNRIPRLIAGGVGVSGNCFIDQAEKRLWLSGNFKALTTDMETAAVAQVCGVNNIPFIAFRSASDLAGGSPSGSAREEIGRFFQVAADNSAKVVMKFLESL
nr:5'-methylthioadenosine/S-adenosylhomocysteine nucleosidase [candidate division Zixibacteria bacterium]